MIKLKLIGMLLLTAGLVIGCSAQVPAAATPPAPLPDTPTAAPVEPTAPANTPAPDTGGGASEEPSTDNLSPPAAGGDNGSTLPDTGMAVVENVDVRILESFPVQVQAVVTGYLPDGCTTITGVEAVNEGTAFRIRITTDRPADAMCTMAITNFEQVVPLDVTELPAGSYQVVVNELSLSFELPGSEPAALPPPEAGEYPVVESATGYVMAQVDVPIYDAPTVDGNEIGLIAGGQIALVTGASPDGAWWRVICADNTVGDCWVSAAPDMTVPASPPN
jgi:hypothetical protein